MSMNAYPTSAAALDATLGSSFAGSPTFFGTPAATVGGVALSAGAPSAELSDEEDAAS